VSLGFSVEALAPRARVNGPMRMGLVRLEESEWLEPAPDLAARNAAFDAHPDSVKVLPEAEAPARELAAMLGLDGGLEAAARSVWEDLCLLTRAGEGEPLLLTGAAVGFPTDWRLAEKIGRPLLAVHQPIHGYAEQLSQAVDSFMDRLAPGEIFGRTNLFVLPSGDLRYMPQDDAATRFAGITADNAGDRLFARCERETLRRLPQTGGIVFTIGVYRCPLGALSDDAVARVAQTLDGFGEGEHGRRAAPHYAAALAGYAEARGRRSAA